MKKNRIEDANFNELLARKALWLNIEFVVVVGFLWGFLSLFYFMGVGKFGSLVMSYLAVSLGHFFYDYYKAYELWVKDDSSLMHAAINIFMGLLIVSGIYYFDGSRLLIENWVMPLGVLFSSRSVYPMVASWPYAKQLRWLLVGMYIFIGIFALIVNQLTTITGRPDFYMVFAGAVYIGLICEYIFELLMVYGVELTKVKGKVWEPALLAFLGTALSLGLVFLLMEVGGLSLMVTYKSVIIAMRLFQPLSMRWILR